MTAAEQNLDGVRILVTGGAGFLGSLLVKRLLADSELSIGGQQYGNVKSLTILDIAMPEEEIRSDPRVQVVVGSIHDSLESLDEYDAIFHLAGVVSGAAEEDFDLGMRTNINETLELLQYARGFKNQAVFVFSSSLAVYGADPEFGRVEEVDDNTLPRPQSSYGIQKFVCEQLVADYSRKGFIDGRSVRLMTVSVRPGRPNAAASSFLSGIIREPLANKEAVCPVEPDTKIALSSPRLTIDGILTAASLGGKEWGSKTAMNLPAITTTPRSMAEAMDKVTGMNRSELIKWEYDQQIDSIVGSWPAVFRTDRARGLGLSSAASFEEIVREYIDKVPVVAN